MGLIIAVDGPAASGKGTIAKFLARTYGLPHLDTGLLYRVVGLAAADQGIDLADHAALAALAQNLDLGALDESRARTAQAGVLASHVAAIPGVRSALLAQQRAFAAQPGGAVLDGRDIGTVICPDATAKIYVDADVTVRAQRRFSELTARGEATTLDAVLADLQARDARDTGRADAPLAMAADAVLLNTTELGISPACDAARRIVETQRTSGSR
jgi:cytidylate kinase